MLINAVGEVIPEELGKCSSQCRLQVSVQELKLAPGMAYVCRVWMVPSAVGTRAPVSCSGCQYCAVDMVANIPYPYTCHM